MGHYLNRNILKIINAGFDHWDNYLPVNRDTIISFINGTKIMLPYNEGILSSYDQHSISGLMCNYIWNKYKIRHLNLERSINYLSVLKKKKWVEVFIDIFNNFQREINWDSGFAEIKREPILNKQLVKKIERGKGLSKYICENGRELRVGSKVQLGNLMKEHYQKTLSFDPDIECPEWDVLVPSNLSFQYVNFLHDETLFGNVTSAYSLMISEILSIDNRERRVFVQTDHFEIEVGKAVEKLELILEEDIIINNNQKWQGANLSKLHERAEHYEMKLITDEEFWHGIVGFNTNAPFFDRKKKKLKGYGFYGTSIKTRWENGDLDAPIG